MNNALAAYQRNAVLSATPVQLLIMLYDRLLLDLDRAKAAQQVEDWAEAGNQLTHAQAIIAELQNTLDVGAWDGGKSLYAVYEYTSRALVNANINRNIKLTEEAISMLEPLREAWRDAADTLPAAHNTGARLA